MLLRLWVRAVAELSRWTLRYWPARAGKILIWRVLHHLGAWWGVTLIGPARFGGRFHCDLRDMIQGRIYYTGVWEPSLTAFVESHLRPGDTFIDIGANIGYFSLLASRIVGPTGAVIALEASPGIADRLAANVRLNGAGNVRVMNVAASDREGTIDLFRGPPGNLGSSSVVSTRGGTLEARVPCAPVSAVVTPPELARARIIKIDVEGHELPVLTDLLRSSDRLHPDVFIIAEIAPEAIAALGSDVTSLFDAFADAGFRWSFIDNDYDFTGLYNLTPRQPTPTAVVPRHQTDVIFSRGADAHQQPVSR